MSSRQAQRTLLVALAALGAAVAAGAGEAPRGELYRTIASLDEALFDAYNRCDLDAFRGLLAEDLEFYHDLDGMLTDREDLVEALRNNICGKVRRELVAASLEVYPIGDSGALETGVHLFHHPGREKVDGIGQGRFTHLWWRSEVGWRLTRVFSYDHRPYEE